MNKLSLLPGVVAPRPPKGSAQAHTSIQPLSPFATAQRFQPLPAPLGAPPYHFDLETALPGIGTMSADAGKIVFHTVGDTGGIKQSDYQMMVVAGMKNDLSQAAPERPAFFYHLGDVVYYNGESTSTTHSSTIRTIIMTRRFFQSQVIMMETQSVLRRHRWMVGWHTS